MVHLPHPRQNRLLNMLEASGESFLSLFQLVYLPQNEILFETGQQLAYSYFPITAVISTVFESTNRLRLETEAIRNDGVFGLPTTIDNLLVTRAIVQSAGHAYRTCTDADSARFPRAARGRCGGRPIGSISRK